jgi:hypothetical protein
MDRRQTKQTRADFAETRYHQPMVLSTARGPRISPGSETPEAGVPTAQYDLVRHHDT